MNTNQWFFIINPMAGGGRLKEHWKSIREEIEQSGLAFQEYFTTHKGDAEAVVRKLIEAGERKFVAVGGDGSNNEVINGILSQDAVPASDIQYSLFPFGTGNDWRKTHDIPMKIKPWLEMLAAGHHVKHNAGFVTYFKEGVQKQRYFINIAGLAYDAHVAKVAESYANEKRRKSLYLWLALKCLPGFKAPKLKVHFGNQTVLEDFYTINIGICKYSGGGMQFTKQAEFNGNEFGLTMIKNFPKWRVPFDLPKLFLGRLANHKYSTVTRAKSIKVEAVEDSYLGVEVDGDFLGEGPLEFTLIKDALTIIVPKSN